MCSTSQPSPTPTSLGATATGGDLSGCAVSAHSMQLAVVARSIGMMCHALHCDVADSHEVYLCFTEIEC